MPCIKVLKTVNGCLSENFFSKLCNICIRLPLTKNKTITLNNIPSVNTCSKPSIANGVVSPESDTVDFGSEYTVACNTGYTASSTEAMSCTAGGTLDAEHMCDSKPLETSCRCFYIKSLTFDFQSIGTVFLVFGD